MIQKKNHSELGQSTRILVTFLDNRVSKKQPKTHQYLVLAEGIPGATFRQLRY